MIFTKKKLKEEEGLSVVLKKAREQKSLQLEDISNKLSIKKDYLESLENGSFEKLPSGIYIKTFLKKYASFLGLDESRLEEKFKQEYKEETIGKDIFSKERVKKYEFLVFSKIVRIGLITMAVLFLFIYLGFYLKLSLSPPKIEIIEPANNLVTKNNFIYIIGKTNPRTEIKINNKLILKNDVGLFEEKVDLKNNLNIIIITGKNKYSKETRIEKQILVK